MKVWILEADTDLMDEGRSLIGIYSTREKAEIAKEENRQAYHLYVLEISQWEVDS